MQSFATERLSVSPWDEGLAAGDGALLDELATVVSPAVTAFLPPALQLSARGDVAAWARRLDAQAAVSLVRLRDGGALAGLLVLSAGAGAVRVGYLLGERHWGRGLASELVAGLVARLGAVGFRGEAAAGVEPGNPASARVLVKAGFRHAGGGQYSRAFE